MESQAPIPSFSEMQKTTLSDLGISNWTIPTHMTAAELLKLYELAAGSSSEITAVEIGSYIGASSLMIAMGLTGRGNLYCIDTWKNNAMTEGTWDTYSNFKLNTESVADTIIMMQSDSSSAGKSFKKKIDFLFINGDHNYAGVKRDVDAWFDKLKSGGTIIMHDSGWAEGVIRVMKEDVIPHLRSHDRLPNMFWGWRK